jgi:hypothetical protein
MTTYVFKYKNENYEIREQIRQNTIELTAYLNDEQISNTYSVTLNMKKEIYDILKEDALDHLMQSVKTDIKLYAGF